MFNNWFKSWVFFRFLFDKHCPDYKYYEFRLAEEEKILAQSKEAEASRNGWWLEFSFFFSILNLCANLFAVYTLAANNASSKAPIGLHRSSFEQKPSYQTPASALYGAYEGSSSQGSSSSYGKIYIVSLSFSNIIWQLSLCLSTVFTWLLIVWLSLKLIHVWHFNCMLSLWFLVCFRSKYHCKFELVFIIICAQCLLIF